MTRGARIHIYPPYAWSIVRRSAALWLLLRLLLAMALALLGQSVEQTFSGSVFLVMIAVVLVWLDARRFHELRYHANLGTSPAYGLAISFATVTILEIAAAMILGVFAR